MLRLSADEFDSAYEIMKAAFPQSELRPYNKMKSLFESEDLLLYGLHMDDELCAAMVVWEFNTFVFLENFAVSEKDRGKGIGAKFLEKIKEEFSKKIVLEVEAPFDEMSRRRIGFYERNGLLLSKFGYMQPPLNEEINEVPLLLMSYPNTMEEDEFKNMKQHIFKKVFKV